MRIDQYLVEKKYFESRSKAQAAIQEGLVLLNTQPVQKASQVINAEEPPQIQILPGLANKYVSRGGVKLEGALKHLQLEVKNKIAFDIGVSTGGFSDCLLQAGAEAVVGVDVGSHQVHESLRKRNQFSFFENTHIKNVSTAFFESHKLPSQFHIIVIDVSFISLTQVVPYLKSFLLKDGVVLALVKPQFEVSSKNLNKKGLVKEHSLYLEVEKNIKSCFEFHNYNVLDYFESSIQGGDGNREFFIYASAIKSSQSPSKNKS